MEVKPMTKLITKNGKIGINFDFLGNCFGLWGIWGGFGLFWFVWIFALAGGFGWGLENY